jgi:ATP-binding cassette subfamily F protein 3
MSLLTAQNISLFFGERAIFDSLSFQVDERDRIGFVGRNGSGKTSLMRMLYGEIDPQGGEITKTKSLRIGYLPQDVTETGRGRVLESLLAGIPGKAAVEDEIHATQKALEESSDPGRQTLLAGRLAELYETLAHFEGVYATHQAEKILAGLGFSENDFMRPLSELSGGWRTRAALAGLLFQRPDVLLLDEPTNHLDVDSVRWVSRFLDDYDKAIILVCHDRQFLNRHINRVISFEAEGVRQYKGDFESYLAQRADEEVILERQARNQEQKVKQAQKFIERFRYKSTKARQAQSKIKVLEKMEIIQRHKPVKNIRFSFPPVKPSGRNVVHIDNVAKIFGDNVLYKNVTRTVLRGERIAVIGKNGAGKTTLLKIVAGELAPNEGQISMGQGVTLSYYAQHQAEQLDLRRSVVEEVGSVAPDASHTFIRNVCGAFLFSGDDVEKSVGVLSGGEKARVALAKLLVRPGNFLLMDEPTNHLDIIASEQLISALAQYDGTIMFVSHNQAFVNRLATKIWDIKNHHLEEYPGSLEEYYDHLERLEDEGQGQSAADCRTAGSRKTKAGGKEDKKAVKRAQADARRMLHQKSAPVKNRLARTEARIDELESEEKSISEQLCDPKVFEDAAASRDFLTRYDKVKKELEACYSAWENDQKALEDIQNELAGEGCLPEDL